jgi:hypothetical protein
MKGSLTANSWLSDAQTRAALNYVEQLRQSVNGLSLPAGVRVLSAASCFGIAREHHHAIILLLEKGLCASAFALVRPAFEAYIRGAWLAFCANEDMVNRFLQGEEPPSLRDLLAELEGTSDFEKKVLSQVEQLYWKAMCDYAHTGGLHVRQWITLTASSRTTLKKRCWRS